MIYGLSICCVTKHQKCAHCKITTKHASNSVGRLDGLIPPSACLDREVTRVAEAPLSMWIGLSTEEGVLFPVCELVFVVSWSTLLPSHMSSSAG